MPPPTRSFDGWTLHCETGELRKGTSTTRLTQQPLKILLALLERPGEVVSRSHLTRVLWPHEAVDFDNSLNAAVRKLRLALGDDAEAPRYIETLARIGYRFIGSIEAPPRHERSSRAGRRTAAILLAVLATAQAASRDTAGREARQAGSPGRQQRLVVLPFSPLLPGRADPALELGMANALITRLSELPGLAVVPIGSVRGFASEEVDPLEAGRALGASVVLEGTLQREGPRLRVTARLLRVDDGQALWSAQYDETLSDIFALQDALTERVTESLIPRLEGPRPSRARQRVPRSVRAYELYLGAAFDRFRRDRDGLPDAIAGFEAALREDPAFAEASSALADALSSQGVLQYEPPAVAFPRARAAALNAVTLDHDLADAHTALGQVYMQYDRDYTAAEREFELARALDDRYAPLWHLSAFLHAYRGRPAEALAAMRRARELEPMNPVYSANFGLVLYHSGANDAAIAHLSELLEAQPYIDQAHSFLAKALIERGDLEGALEQLRARGRPTLGMADLGRVHALAGRRVAALAEVARLERLGTRGFGVGYDLALVYTALGDTRKACAALERALTDHSQMLGWLSLDPGLASLRAEPCFAEVDRRRVLPPTPALPRTS